MEIENNENDNNNQVQQIPSSLQGEINLVKEEEEENKDGPNQKERLEKILNKLNQDNDKEEQNIPEKKEEQQENQNEEQPQRNAVLRGIKKVIGTVTPTKLTIKKQVPEPFDTTFNLEKEYFYKELENKEWDRSYLFFKIIFPKTK